MLTIYKASAGSGKTFRLVIEYLKLILLNEYNYKHILAVTFTNKATAEMKERVVKQLSEISQGVNNAYTNILLEETGLSAEDLKQKAHKALRNILHDYSRFSVSTIDKFTQRVLKAFNRELGITPGYVLELDNEMILQEAADRLILKVGENKNLLKWLKNLGEERIRNEKSFHIKSEILKLGKELFKENFQVFFTVKNKELYDREHLKEYSKELSKITCYFSSEIKKKGLKALSIIENAGYESSDFSYGKNGIAGYLEKLAEGDIPQPGKRVLNANEDPDSWVGKKHAKRIELIGLVENSLYPVLNEIIDFYETNIIQFNSAKKILDNLYTLGILNDLQSEIDEIRYEKGILPISDSNLLLKKIIGDSDSPFIYEKIGNIFNHFMLDEFQDTSGLQWNNFRPLVQNALAEGNSNLAVGDVKQSIYRWRNSDWRILAHGIEEDFKGQNINVISLDYNWRSAEAIIKLNNTLLPGMVESFKAAFDNEYLGSDDNLQNPYSAIFEKIYSDIKQNPGKENKKKKGFVRFNFLEQSEEVDYQEQSVGLLIEQVKQLQNEGFRSSDIAILIRRKADGLPIIKTFLEASEDPDNAGYNFDIISNESMFLSSSKSVSFIIQLVRHLVDPDDLIAKATILSEFKNYLQPALRELNKEIVFNSINDEGQHQFNFTVQPESLPEQLSGSFEDEFESTFAPLIKQIKIAILNSSIDEAITRICKSFNLFDLREDVPFIQALIDQAAQIKANYTNDLSNFLKWWDEKGANLSVNVNDQTDAIRLFTVHKSKGLEFKVVLIPFFDWPILWGGTQTPTLWCEPHSEPFNQLPLVPIKANKNMAQTLFAREYFDEVFSTFVDCLNLVYVAFTRAKSVLMVNAPFKENNRTLEVNKLLFELLENLGDTEEWGEYYDRDNRVFQYGELIYEKDKEMENEKIISVSPDKYFFADFNQRLKLRINADDFFSEPQAKTNKNMGRILHEILSEIVVADDVIKACKNALHKRKINIQEYQNISKELNKLINSSQAIDWFSGKYSVMNERPLLSKSKNLRPDRVMIADKEAIVVDYKLDEADSVKYYAQVSSYAQTLKNTGFDNVKGYLWYLKPNRIDLVCEL